MVWQLFFQNPPSSSQACDGVYFKSFFMASNIGVHGLQHDVYDPHNWFLRPHDFMMFLFIKVYQYYNCEWRNGVTIILSEPPSCSQARDGVYLCYAGHEVGA